MDFVTIVFDNDSEYCLLKLQALSYKFIEPSIVNNIVIVFNDNNKLIEKFNNIFKNDIEHLYPEKLRHLIKIIYLEDLKLNFEYSNWYTQQIVKILISKKINTKYYVILDGKNHFIKDIKYDYFFHLETNKPIIYYNMQGKELLDFYHNSLNYFNVTCPNPPNHHINYKIQTITPYTFITSECLDMIEYIENKENMPFDKFFIEKKKYTEFYLYFAYLIFKEKQHLYHFKTNLMPVLTIGPQNPNNFEYNRWDYKLSILEQNAIYAVALHRLCIYVLNSEYKENLIKFYKNFFSDKEIDIFRIFLYSYNL